MAIVIGLLLSASNAAFPLQMKSQKRLKGSGQLMAAAQRTTRIDGYKIVNESRNEDIDSQKGNVITCATSEHEISDGNFIFLNYRQVSTRNGKPYIQASIDYDWNQYQGVFSLNDFENHKTYGKIINIDFGSIPVQVLDEYLCLKAASRINEDAFRLTFPTGDSIKMKAVFSYAPVTAEAFGIKYSCCLIEIKPDFGFISGLISSAKYYFSLNAPTRLIRYEGTQGGPGSPDIIQEFAYQ